VVVIDWWELELNEDEGQDVNDLKSGKESTRSREFDVVFAHILRHFSLYVCTSETNKQHNSGQKHSA
jgi:hypothetical protein